MQEMVELILHHYGKEVHLQKWRRQGSKDWPNFESTTTIY